MTAVHELDATSAKAWLDRGDTLLIDVREPAEHARERIPGARLFPLSRFDTGSLDLGGVRRVIVHCASGLRSRKAAEQMAIAGVGEVANLQGGLPSWKAAGLPTLVDSRVPLPLMRQVQLIAGALVLLGIILGSFAHPAFYVLSALVGGGLFIAGATGWCGMAMLLARLPYNRQTTS